MRASCAAAFAHGPCRLTQRLQLAGGTPREEIHLCGGGLVPAAEAQAVRRLDLFGAGPLIHPVEIWIPSIHLGDYQ